MNVTVKTKRLVTKRMVDVPLVYAPKVGKAAPVVQVCIFGLY